MNILVILLIIGVAWLDFPEGIEPHANPISKVEKIGNLSKKIILYSLE